MNISVVSFKSMAPVMPVRQGMMKNELLERKVRHLLKKRWSNDIKERETHTLGGIISSLVFHFAVRCWPYHPNIHLCCYYTVLFNPKKIVYEAYYGTDYISILYWYILLVCHI